MVYESTTQTVHNDVVKRVRHFVLDSEDDLCAQEILRGEECGQHVRVMLGFLDELQSAEAVIMNEMVRINEFQTVGAGNVHRNLIGEAVLRLCHFEATAHVVGVDQVQMVGTARQTRLDFWVAGEHFRHAILSHETTSCPLATANGNQTVVINNHFVISRPNTNSRFWLLTRRKI